MSDLPAPKPYSEMTMYEYQEFQKARAADRREKLIAQGKMSAKKVNWERMLRGEE